MVAWFNRGAGMYSTDHIEAVYYIKNCPLCGHRPKVFMKENKEANFDLVWISCYGCKMTLHPRKSIKLLIRTWNSRVN